jgi:hypothetical protein
MAAARPQVAVARPTTWASRTTAPGALSSDDWATSRDAGRTGSLRRCSSVPPTGRPGIASDAATRRHRRADVVDCAIDCKRISMAPMFHVNRRDVGRMSGDQPLRRRPARRGLAAHRSWLRIARDMRAADSAHRGQGREGHSDPAAGRVCSAAPHDARPGQPIRSDLPGDRLRRAPPESRRLADSERPPRGPTWRAAHRRLGWLGGGRPYEESNSDRMFAVRRACELCSQAQPLELAAGPDASG